MTLLIIPKTLFLMTFLMKILTTLNTVEQRALRSLNNCLNTNIYSNFEASGGQSSNLYLNVVHFFNAIVYLISVVA